MFKIEIDMDNDAFEGDTEAEVARILRALAEDVENGDMERHLRDYNGNQVGLSYID